MAEKTSRLEYLDFLKGFAIFLVVMGHFLAWTFPPEVDRGYYPMLVKNAIYTFHMPLFFFVSGYLVDFKKKEWRFKTGLTLIWRRIVTLLLPGFAFFLLLFARTGALYYEWFLKVLFEMCLVFALTKVFCHYVMKKVPLEMVVHAVVVGLLFFAKSKVSGTFFSETLSFSSFCNSYPYFLLGYVYCKFGWNEYVMSKKWIYSLCLILWGVIFFVAKDFSIPGSKYILAVSAIVACVKLSQDLNYEKKSLVVKKMIQWGKISLAIYLVSPMIIPWFPELGLYFIKADAYEPFGNVTHSAHITTVFLQVVAGVAISTYVCVICAMIRKIVSRSPVLNLVFFGERSNVKANG